MIKFKFSNDKIINVWILYSVITRFRYFFLKLGISFNNDFPSKNLWEVECTQRKMHKDISDSFYWRARRANFLPSPSYFFFTWSLRSRCIFRAQLDYVQSYSLPSGIFLHSNKESASQILQKFHWMCITCVSTLFSPEPSFSTENCTQEYTYIFIFSIKQVKFTREVKEVKTLLGLGTNLQMKTFYCDYTTFWSSIKERQTKKMRYEIKGWGLKDTWYLGKIANSSE